MLHLAHASAAADALRAAHLPGEVVVWCADAAARLAREQGETVLWFGASTDEQRAMLEAVVACPEGVPVSFVCTEPAIAEASPVRLTWLFHHRPMAGAAFFRLCGHAHAALQKGRGETERILPGLDALPLVQQALQ